MTVAAIRDLDGSKRPLLFDGAPHLPSGVFRAADGTMLTGREGADAGLGEPDRYVSMPALLLASSPAPGADDAVDLVAATLRRVGDQASRLDGQPVDGAVLVVPAGWGPQRRTRMRTAAAQAGLADVDVVDTATAITTHHLAALPRRALRNGAPIVVYRVFGDWCEAVVLRRTESRWARLAVHDGETGDGVDAGPNEVAGRVARLVAEAVAAADVSADEIALMLGQVPPNHARLVAARVRDAGIRAPTRGVGEFDAVLGALPEATSPAPPARRRPLAHVVAVLTPLLATPVLVWLLLATGVLFPDVFSDLYREPPPPYIYTFWPAWSLVAVLVLLGVAAIALILAERLPADTESERRRRLATGLRVAAAFGLTAGLVTASLGARTYVVVPVWFLLLVTTGPVLLIALSITVVGLLIRYGQTSAAEWQAWLRFPNAAVVLMAVGVIASELHALTNTSIHSYQFHPGLRDVVAQLGSVAVALAVAATLLRRAAHQIIVSPVVIATAAVIHDYTTTWIVMGVLVATTMLWWLRRLRPVPLD